MNWLDFINSVLPAGVFMVIKAAIILLLAFIVATIGKKLSLKLVSHFTAKTKMTEQNAGDINNFVSKFVYLFIFLLFVPSIFGVLGISSVADPIVSILATVWGYIPNIIAAVIILIIGFMIAKLVRQLLSSVLEKCNLNKLQEKLGVEASGSSKLSSTLAYIVYVLILIPVIITALTALKINAISEPAINILNIVFDFIPNIVVGILIIFIGVKLAKFAGQIVERLIGATGLNSKLSSLLQKESFIFSKMVGKIVQIVIVIFFVVQGVNTLHLYVLTNIGSAIIAYMPNVLAAVLILLIAFIISEILEKALRKNGYVAYAVIVKYAVLVIGAFMVLNQLGIATRIVNAAFIIILAALGVSFAVAFGIGGRKFASDMLERLETKIFDNKKDNE